MSTRFRYCGELLSNTGFETAGTGGADVFGSWTETPGNGAIADEGSLVHAGSHAAKLTAGASSNTTLRQTIVVRPGFDYTLTFYTRGASGKDGKYQIYDVTGAADIVAVTDTGITGDTYTLVTVPFTAPAACVSVYIYLGCPVENAGIAYFDDISVLPADFAFDAETNLSDEPVGEEWEAASGKVQFRARSTTGRRNVWDVSVKGCDPDEREMLRAAYDAALLAGCTWMAWDETTATTVRSKAGSWRQTPKKRSNNTAIYDVSFSLRQETAT